MSVESSLPSIATLALALAIASVSASGCRPNESTAPAPEPTANAEPTLSTEPTTVRFAVFNIWELSAAKVDVVEPAADSDSELRGVQPQLRAAAEVIQRQRPDVLLLNEIDYDAERQLPRLFIDRYLAFGDNGQAPIDYPYLVYLPVNTGVPSGFDFSGDGDADDPEDGWGFGRYPGQYGMALLSRLPIDEAGIRTFRELRWRDMPGHLMPDGGDQRPEWYSPDAAAAFRLSSKSHWDVPLRIGEQTVHILASHPTPPSFDGEEDRNGRRNFDEIRLWADYLTGGEQAAYLVDDQGGVGGLAADQSFIVMGDLNADPYAEPVYGSSAIAQLLEHPRVADPLPLAPTERASKRPYDGDRRLMTSDYGRIDYVLPSRDLRVVGSGVFYPPANDPLHQLVAGDDRASDHQMVWVDIALD